MSQGSAGRFVFPDLTADVPAEGSGGPPGAGRGRTRGWRGLLAWSATSAPVALLLGAGLICGPRGINLLTVATLSTLAPVIPVALAALGVLVGLGVRSQRSGDRRIVVAAVVVAAVTMIVVALGLAVPYVATWSPLVRPDAILIAGAAVAAATSLTLPNANPLELRSPSTRIIELGVLLPIVAGGLALAWLRVPSPAAVVFIAEALGITLLMTAAAWLLLSRPSSETDERVIAVAALLLIGGVAATLSLSALFGGLVAGLFWRFAGRHPRATISRDVLFVQHPLLVLVLLVAGARAEVSPAAVALGGGYVALRTFGQLAGAAVARRVAGAMAPPDLAVSLLPPGVFGVAFALNAVAVVGADAALLLGVVVIGTIGSELVALLVPHRSVDA
jgi:hypothetical protein